MGEQTDLVSVNVGLPKRVQFKADSVRTGIFKKPVSGQVSLMQTNLEGMAKPTCRHMAVLIRQYMLIHSNTTTIGEMY